MTCFWKKLPHCLLVLIKENILFNCKFKKLKAQCNFSSRTKITVYVQNENFYPNLTCHSVLFWSNGPHSSIRTNNFRLHLPLLPVFLLPLSLWAAYSSHSPLCHDVNNDDLLQNPKTEWKCFSLELVKIDELDLGLKNLCNPTASQGWLLRWNGRWTIHLLEWALLGLHFFFTADQLTSRSYLCPAVLQSVPLSDYMFIINHQHKFLFAVFFGSASDCGLHCSTLPPQFPMVLLHLILIFKLSGYVAEKHT